MEALLTMLLSERFGQSTVTAPARPASPQAEQIRNQVRQSLAGTAA
jgi:hypothetical protein